MYGKRKLVFFSFMLILIVVAVYHTPIFGSSKETTLVLWLEKPRLGLLEGVISELFNEYIKNNPHVKIKYEPWVGTPTEYEIKLLAALASGKGPDILATHDSTMFKYIRYGVIVPAPPDVSEFVKKEALNEGVLESLCDKDGTVYGAPWIGDWVCPFYNKDMFAEAGILDPKGKAKPPQNWEELIDATRKLTKHDEKGEVKRSGISLRKSGHPSGIVDKWTAFLYAAGGKLFKEEMSAAAFNSPEALEALQLYWDLLYKYKVDSVTLPADTHAFMNGFTAYYMRESPNIKLFFDKAPKLNFGVSTIPRHRYPSNTTAFVDALSVATLSQNKEEGWKLIKFLCGVESTRRRCMTAYDIPMLKSVASDPWFRENEYMASFMTQQSKTLPPHEKIYEMQATLGKYIEQVCFGKLSPKEALEKAEADVNKMLKK